MLQRLKDSRMLRLLIGGSAVAGAGGDVDVRSTPGAGTTFTVTLPAAPVP